MPLVFDPFAGGGAIPLEAARLGCRVMVTTLIQLQTIQKGSAEFLKSLVENRYTLTRVQ